MYIRALSGTAIEIEAVGAGAAVDAVIRILQRRDLFVEASPEEIPTREYGKEVIDSLVVEMEKLVFDGTIVNVAETKASMELKNNAEVKNAEASEINADHCSSLGDLKAVKGIVIKNSHANNVFSGRNVDVRNSTINELNFLLNSTISDSIVESIIVRSNKGGEVRVVIAGDVMRQAGTNVYLENSIVKDIQFEAGLKGNVYLRGNSQITGQVVHGNVIQQ